MSSYWQVKQAALRAEAEKPKKKPKKQVKKQAALPEDLSEMSLKDLKSLAAEVGVEGRSSMNKGQLVKALS